MNSTKYTFTIEHPEGNRKLELSFSSDGVTWMELTQEFLNLLRAEGYSIGDIEFHEVGEED